MDHNPLLNVDLKPVTVNVKGSFNTAGFFFFFFKLIIIPVMLTQKVRCLLCTYASFIPPSIESSPFTDGGRRGIGGGGGGGGMRDDSVEILFQHLHLEKSVSK